MRERVGVRATRPVNRMAFNPHSDVILEVLNAADLDKAAASAPQASVPAEGLANARSRLAALADGPDKATRAKVEFEATLINSFIGELLPKDAGSVFGAGSTGDMWRSMLSEQISQQIAKSGALGLSRRLFATHDLVPARHGEAATPPR